MPCNGKCHKYRALKPRGVNIGRYASGQSRCQICEIFIEWEGFHCPCCNYRLRKNPRNVKYKNKLHDNLITKCTGYQYGTGCTNNFTQSKDQEKKLCVSCDRILHPEFYNSKGEQSCVV